jgi:hypothetical protein
MEHAVRTFSREMAYYGNQEVVWKYCANISTRPNFPDRQNGALPEGGGEMGENGGYALMKQHHPRRNASQMA